FDVFVFGGGAPSTDTPIARGAVDATVLVGYSSEPGSGGAYVGGILAGGAELGGTQNFAGHFEGVEGTCSLAGCSGTQISITEAQVGLEIPLIAGAGVGA